MKKFIVSALMCSSLALSANAGKIHDDIAKDLGTDLSTISRIASSNSGNISVNGRDEDGATWNMSVQIPNQADLYDALSAGRLVTTGAVDYAAADKSGFARYVMRGFRADGKTLLPGEIIFLSQIAGTPRPTTARGNTFWFENGILSDAVIQGLIDRPRMVVQGNAVTPTTRVNRAMLSKAFKEGRVALVELKDGLTRNNAALTGQFDIQGVVLSGDQIQEPFTLNLKLSKAWSGNSALEEMDRLAKEEPNATRRGNLRFNVAREYWQENGFNSTLWPSLQAKLEGEPWTMIRLIGEASKYRALTKEENSAYVNAMNGYKSAFVAKLNASQDPVREAIGFLNASGWTQMAVGIVFQDYLAPNKAKGAAQQIFARMSTDSGRNLNATERSWRSQAQDW